jgi:hypothetical protein
VLTEPSSVTYHLVNNLAIAAVSAPSMHEQVGGQSQSELDMGILSGDKSVKEVIDVDGLGATSNTRGLRQHKKKSSSSSTSNKEKSSKASKRGGKTNKPTFSPSDVVSFELPDAGYYTDVSAYYGTIPYPLDYIFFISQNFPQNFV